jgi:hypothetical protein
VKDPFALLFDWPARHAVHLGLPVAIVLSVLIHLGGLAAFGLKPTRSARLPGEAVVYWLDAAGASGEILAGMAEAADPALFSAMALEESGADSMPGISYSPAYKEWEPEYLPVPVFSEACGSTAMLDEPVLRNNTPAPVPPPPPEPPTRLVLEGGLKDRMTSMPADAGSFSAPSRQSLLPTEFLICVSPAGRVLHAFPLSGSGYEALDAAALAALLSTSFAPDPDSPPVWTSATFLWGADLKRTRPPEP